METRNKTICINCGMGELQAVQLFFFGTHRGYPICIPHFPGWYCRICGFKVYDPRALNQLNALFFTSESQAVPPSEQGGQSAEEHPGFIGSK